MKLKSIRKSKGITQEEAARLLGVSRRTYINYERNELSLPEVKLNYLCKVLNEYGIIDEDHGVLTVDQIKSVCEQVFNDYDVEYCYLFGSYAKSTATDKSDVDLLISTTVKGMRYFGLVETLREALHKKVDLLDAAQLEHNIDLAQEILRDGIKIYG